MIFIKFVMKLIRVLKIDCNLAILGIQNKIFFICEVILLVIKNQDS